MQQARFKLSDVTDPNVLRDSSLISVPQLYYYDILPEVWQITGLTTISSTHMITSRIYND